MILLEWSIKNAGRIKAVSVKPKPAGLTIIGGKNRQGKSTNLDMIAWGLGGDTYRPAEPNHRGAKTPAEIDFHTDNGLHIWRSGKNGALHVKNEKTGEDGDQSLLNKFVTSFALDLRKFQRAKDRERCDILLKGLGLDVQVAQAQKWIDEEYERRLLVNRELHRKEAAFKESRQPEELPMDEPINVDGLVAQLQRANDNNAKRQQELKRKEMLSESIQHDQAEIKRLEELIEQLRSAVQIKAAEIESMPEPRAAVETDPIQQDIGRAHQLNADYGRIMQQRRDCERVSREFEQARKDAVAADAAVEQARAAKMELLASAWLPDPEIGVEDGELTYKGDTWDALAASDELILCCKIVCRLNPECRFVLVDELEKMDLDTLAAFDEWAEKEGLQVIGTRVSTGDECDLIIVDGQVAEEASETA